MEEKIFELLGKFPVETGRIKRERLHQAWWRTFVLCKEQGNNPNNKNDSICNTLKFSEHNDLNFLSKNIIKAIELTFKERESNSLGLISEERLFCNLLSSQPLCFNFFGEMKINNLFARNVLKKIWPMLTKVRFIKFEYAPIERYSNDNSAFDVAIEAEIDNKVILIGIECKYTEDFSKKEYNNPKYREIHNESNAFKDQYELLISSNYNQLFRSQVIAESLVLDKKYDDVFTCLFCHDDDQRAIETGNGFKTLLVNGDTRFKVITYNQLITAMQTNENLEWELREYSMLLWARYCGKKLSERIKIS